MREYFVWLAKMITLVLLIFVVVPVALITSLASVGKVVSDKIGDPSKAVAVVELKGVIEDSKDVLNEISKNLRNKHVKGIVLSINSPGGSVGPSQEIYEAVRRWKTEKPIVAVMGSVAASGGLYSALGASKILAQPGTLTGSIGVIMQVPNLSKVANWAGVDMVTIKSGKLKDVGNQFREMLPEEREYLEKSISTVHDQFINAVVEGRSLDKEKVLAFADGRIVLGSEAKEYGLIDGYGDVYEGGRLIFELLGQPLKAGELPSLVFPDDTLSELKRALQTLSFVPGILRGEKRMMFIMP
jgi:protease IV